uniref:C2 domain-containing protein n=1 Tax=Hucho hucho TaxID=62062 RepID=A0A4W5MFI5_9TELE
VFSSFLSHFFTPAQLFLFSLHSLLSSLYPLTLSCRFTICHKTEVVKNTLNPVWQSFTIPVRALCNGDFDRTIKIEVYDWDRDGSHDFIGEFTTSYRELARGQSQFNVYEVVNIKKKMKKKKYGNSGTVIIAYTL